MSYDQTVERILGPAEQPGLLNNRAKVAVGFLDSVVLLQDRYDIVDRRTNPTDLAEDFHFQEHDRRDE